MIIMPFMMKTDGRKLTGKALVAVWVRAAKAVVEGGMARCQASTLFGVSRQIVGEWGTAYKSGGEEILFRRVSADARKAMGSLPSGRRRRSPRLSLTITYSPDLNPDEMLNNDVKSNAVGRKRAKDRPPTYPQCPRLPEEPAENARNGPPVFPCKNVRYAA
ncbi:MAG: hypothetical protein WC708_03035 [Lentisphaeria bacterium]